MTTDIIKKFLQLKEGNLIRLVYAAKIDRREGGYFSLIEKDAVKYKRKTGRELPVNFNRISLSLKALNVAWTKDIQNKKMDQHLLRIIQMQFLASGNVHYRRFKKELKMYHVNNLKAPYRCYNEEGLKNLVIGAQTFNFRNSKYPSMQKMTHVKIYSAPDSWLIPSLLDKIFSEYNRKVAYLQEGADETLRVIIKTVQSIFQCIPFEECNLRTVYILLQRLLPQWGFLPVILNDPFCLLASSEKYIITELRKGMQETKILLAASGAVFPQQYSAGLLRSVSYREKVFVVEQNREENYYGEVCDQKRRRYQKAILKSANCLKKNLSSMVNFDEEKSEYSFLNKKCDQADWHYVIRMIARNIVTEFQDSMLLLETSLQRHQKSLNASSDPMNYWQNYSNEQKKEEKKLVAKYLARCKYKRGWEYFIELVADLLERCQKIKRNILPSTVVEIMFAEDLFIQFSGDLTYYFDIRNMSDASYCDSGFYSKGIKFGNSPDVYTRLASVDDFLQNLLETLQCAVKGKKLREFYKKQLVQVEENILLQKDRFKQKEAEYAQKAQQDFDKSKRLIEENDLYTIDKFYNKKKKSLYGRDISREQEQRIMLDYQVKLYHSPSDQLLQLELADTQYRPSSPLKKQQAAIRKRRTLTKLINLLDPFIIYLLHEIFQYLDEGDIDSAIMCYDKIDDETVKRHLGTYLLYDENSMDSVIHFLQKMNLKILKRNKLPKVRRVRYKKTMNLKQRVSAPRSS